MSHDAPVSLRPHGGEETLRLKAKEDGEETEAKEDGEETQAKEDRPVLPESLRQQLTVAKQTRQLGPLGNVGKHAGAATLRELATSRDLARGPTPLWCSLAARQAVQHCAQQHSALMQAQSSHDHRRCRHHHHIHVIILLVVVIVVQRRLHRLRRRCHRLGRRRRRQRRRQRRRPHHHHCHRQRNRRRPRPPQHLLPVRSLQFILQHLNSRTISLLI